MPSGDSHVEMRMLQKRLPVRVAAAQGVGEELTGCSIEMETDQTVWPVAIDREGLLKQADAPEFVGSTEEDNQRLPRVVRQRSEQPGSRGRGIGLGRMFDPMCQHELVGTLRHFWHRAMSPALPHLLLPEVIVTFDLGLKAGLPWRNEDWNDAKAQTQMYDAAEAVRMAVGALEARVVVELNELRTTEVAPVLRQTFQYVVGENAPPRPRHRHTAIERNAIEDLHFSSVTNDQSFDDIEGIEFSLPSRHVREVPARGWWRPALSRALNQTVLRQDSADGAYGRQWADAFRLELSADGDGAVFTQRRMAFEPKSQAKDTLQDATRRSMLCTEVAAGPVLPVDPIESAACGAMHPFENCAHATCETHGDVTHGRTAAHRCDHSLS